MSVWYLCYVCGVYMCIDVNVCSKAKKSRKENKPVIGLIAVQVRQAIHRPGDVEADHVSI